MGLALPPSATELLGLVGVAAHRADRLAQEVRHAHARDGGRVLEGQEQAGLGALVRRQAEDALPVQQDIAPGDLVVRVAGDGVGQRALAGAVRPHQRVHFALADGQVDALQDRLAFDGDVQVFDHEFGRHESYLLEDAC